MQIVTIVDYEPRGLYCPFCGKATTAVRGEVQKCSHLVCVAARHSVYYERDGEYDPSPEYAESGALADYVGELRLQDLSDLELFGRLFPGDKHILFIINPAHVEEVEICFLYKYGKD